MFVRFVPSLRGCVRSVLYNKNIRRYINLFFSFVFLCKKVILYREMSGLGACCVDPGAKQSHEAQGSEEKIAGVNTYKTGQGKSAIILFTDVFGYSFINTRKLADSFAQGAQATAFIPDLFNGDPIDPNTPNIFDILPEWLKKHPPTDGCNIADKFVSTIKGNYQSIQVNNKYSFIQSSLVFILGYWLLLWC